MGGVGKLVGASDGLGDGAIDGRKRVSCGLGALLC